jgi:hypothetical protein
LSSLLLIASVSAHAVSVTISQASHQLLSYGLAEVGVNYWNSTYDEETSSLIDPLALNTLATDSAIWPNLGHSQGTSYGYLDGFYSINGGEHTIATDHRASLSAVSAFDCPSPGCSSAPRAAARMTGYSFYRFSIGTASPFAFHFSTSFDNILLEEGTTRVSLYDDTRGEYVANWASFVQSAFPGDSGTAFGNLRPGNYSVSVLSNFVLGSGVGQQRTAFPNLLTRLTLDPNPVPIPSAVWIFGGALGALGVLKRKTRAAE